MVLSTIQINKSRDSSNKNGESSLEIDEFPKNQSKKQVKFENESAHTNVLSSIDY